MPNLIHSLDAVTLAELINMYFKGESNVKNIYTIHDCFGMSIREVNYVIDLLKIVYCSLYFQDQYLNKLDTGIIQHIKNILGEKLDFNSLNKSSYIIN